MKSLFRKSLTLALVAVLMSLMVSCAHSAGNGTTAAAGEGTSGAAGESTPGGADSGQQLVYHRCRPVEG